MTKKENNPTLNMNMIANRSLQKTLSAQAIFKEFNGIPILEDITLSINPRNRIGLVGKNGAGKTTLLNILSGDEEPDRGKVHRNSSAIGYLKQVTSIDNSLLVSQFISDDVRGILNSLDQFYQMAQNYNTEQDFLQQYEDVNNSLLDNDAFALEERIQTICQELGLIKVLDSPLGNLSGGELMRTRLARMLIASPDILLLDEPTNHLDIKANIWLRQFIRDWVGGLLIVSHDRNFLDEVTDTTWEIDQKNLRIYGGNYSFYRVQKGIEEGSQEREYILLTKSLKTSKKKMVKEQERASHSARRDLSIKPEDHDRARAHYFKDRATRTSGKNKKKFKETVEEVSKEVENAKLLRDSLIVPTLEGNNPHRNKSLIVLSDFVCGYNEDPILTGDSFVARGSDRIALFGNNGSGKTTFLRSIKGDSDVFIEGELSVATNLSLQFLDQNYSIVNREESVLENTIRANPTMNRSDIRQHLARYLFRKNSEIDKIAARLSGGELARLSLAMITTSNIDLLILDEPTNNVDIPTIEQLEKSLTNFKGSVIVVSHDLAFLQNLGITNSYVISEGKLHKMTFLPADELSFKEELLVHLQT